jgi:serine/threonine protein kinase
VEADELGRLGPYRVLKLLGMGGMGMVFLAEDASLGRPVALKVMRPEFIRNKEKDESRFLREARAMAAIKHARLATLYHADKVGDTIYLAMELLEGETLEAWIDKTAKADIVDVVCMARDVALGLAAIHDAGLVHRDLKPSNLWLEHPSGRVKILDFGLAREVKDNTQITEAGHVIGTPAFLSPEQARGRPADHLSDLFSLGCVLYSMCTRKLPFPADNNLAQLAAITSDDPPPPQKFNANLPQELTDLVLELLAKDPRRRPQSAEEVADRLQQIKRQLTGEPRNKKKSSERLDIRLLKEPFVQRHAMTLVVGAFAAIILASIAITAALVLSNKETDRKDAKGKDGVAGVKAGAPAFLDQLKPTRTANWPFQGPKGKGPPPGIDGRVSVNGKLSPHGIFMHPAPMGDPTFIIYQLDKKYRTFMGRVTLNDSGEQFIAPVIFSIYGDDRRLWESKPVRSRANPQDFSIAVSDVTSLRIQVDVEGDPKGAHAVWVDPRLE